MATTGKINIAGALHAIDTTGVVVYTGDVYDDSLNDNQNDINTSVKKAIVQITDSLQEVDTNIKNTDQKFGQINNSISQINQSILNLEQRPALEDGSVTTSKVANGAITKDKLAEGLLDNAGTSNFKYKVLTESEYQTLPEKLENTFYFTYNTEEGGSEETTTAAVLKGNVLETEYILKDDILETTGTLDKYILDISVSTESTKNEIVESTTYNTLSTKNEYTKTEVDALIDTLTNKINQLQTTIASMSSGS